MKVFDDRLIVVTGGAGFIGSAVLRYLNDKGFNNIIVVDHLGTDEKWKNLVKKQFIDIVEPADMFCWLEGKEQEIEAFIHLGACSSTVEKDASFLLENNTHFSIQLAEYALKHEHRFIYASSAATYGRGKLGFSDEHEMLDELEPLNMYGYSKHLFDLWLKRQGVLNQVVGLKYFNVFGPNEWHKGRMSSVVLQLLPKVLSDGALHLFKSSEPDLYANGEQKRDFIYIKDAVRMTLAFLENEAGGIFNIGTGVAQSWNRLAKAMFKAAGKKENIQYIDMPEDLVGKYQNYTAADVNKLKSILKESAHCMPLEESVADYIQNHLIPGATW